MAGRTATAAGRWRRDRGAADLIPTIDQDAQVRLVHKIQNPARLFVWSAKAAAPQYCAYWATTVDGLEQLGVMVVDHNPWVRFTVSDCLAQAGASTVEASNGASALRRALVEAPHVVIVGSELSELATPELIRDLRSDPRTRHTAIVGVGAGTDVDACLHMRFNSVAVLATVMEALELRRRTLADMPMRSVSASPPGTRPLGESSTSRATSRTKVALRQWNRANVNRRRAGR